MAGLLRLNNVATGKWFQVGMGFKTHHGSDVSRDPAPKGYVFIKTDTTQKTGRFAPIFRYMWNNTKKYWVSNEYPEKKINFITAENFRKLPNVSVTDLYALGDKNGNPISLGASPSFTDFQLGLILGHDGTVKLADPSEEGVETVEKLDDSPIPTEVIKEMEIADEHPMDSIIAKAIKVDASGGGYSPANEPTVTFSDNGNKVTYSDASGPLLLPAPPRVLLLAAPEKPLFLPAGDKSLPTHAIINLLTWGGYPEWLAKLVLNAEPQRACLLLESKYKPGTCWSLAVKDPLLAILTGSLSGNSAPWNHPCILDVVDWTAGVIYVWVMTGAAPDNNPRPNMQPFIEWFLPAHHNVVDNSGTIVPIPKDPRNRNETVAVIYNGQKPITGKEPQPKPSYVCFVRVAFRIADLVSLSPMGTFSVTDETLKKLRDYNQLHGDPNNILKAIKAAGYLSKTAEQKLTAAGYKL